jgi:4-hydroxy-tetrahydrodipicolinate synthase
MKLKGVFTALVTPFHHGEVDYNSLESLVKHQLNDGVQGFVVHGTTGESPTVTSEEKEKIFSFIRKLVPKGFPLIVGTGTNSTAETIKNSKLAESWGADALLVVVPYYNKPPQKGLFEHFMSVANAVNIPILLYNVPGRTITALELETIKKLSKHPHIVGIKEASGNLDFGAAIRRECGNEFILLSGDDGTYDDFMKFGDGVISVASHIIPKAFLNKTATRHLGLINKLFCETNPIPVKMALQKRGIIQSAECRLPLVTMSESNTKGLVEILKKEGLLE